MPAGSRLRVRRADRRPGRPLVPLALLGVGALAVLLVAVGLERAWQARNRPDPADPAVRVSGAVRSISGSSSVRRARYDPDEGSVRVEATSRYYDPARAPAENREYLATEGRLGAQLALFDNPSLRRVTVLLFTGRTLLATVAAEQGQPFERMAVDYSGPASRP